MRSLAAKTFLKAGDRAVVVGAPKGFAGLDDRPDGVELATGLAGGSFDWILAFVTRLERARALLPRVKVAAAGGARIWIAYPKGGAQAAVPTDLNRDILWREAEDHGLEGVAMVAIDDTWSAMRFKVS